MGLFKKSKKDKIEVTEVIPETDNNELIAVISAAVAAYLSEAITSVHATKFRVVSFKKVNNNWRV